MNTVSITEPLVSVTWLSENMEADNLIILNGTIPVIVDDNSSISNTQIPNAQFFDIKKKFSDVTSDNFPNAIPSEEQFTNQARLLGINKDSAIVVYDEKGIYSSARVWWLFRTFGHNNVAVLDGGFPEWLEHGLPIEKKKNNSFQSGDFEAKYQAHKMCFFDDIVKATKDKKNVILDARSKNRFQGIVPEPRKGLRSGTIPNSKNLPFTELIVDGKLKSKTELRTTFSKFARKEDHVFFSCGSGITACVLALGAELSEYKNITVYDGSWTEYGSLTPN